MKITRRSFFQTAAASAMVLGGCIKEQQSAAGKKPNILFIFSDQQHFQALGFMDGFFDTPNQDELAAESVVFEKGFCTTPQCSPSRSSILTGYYPGKTGVMGNIGAAGGEPLRQYTIGKMLHDNGYYTGYYGKWHLGSDETPRQGWDEGFDTDSGKYNTSNDLETSKTGSDFIRSGRWGDKPFALFLSFLDPHDIYKFQQHRYDENINVPLPSSWEKETFINKPAVQKQFMLQDQGAVIWDKPRELWQQYRDCYRSKVKIFDDYVGQVISELKKQQLWDDTIIILTSDHGDMDANHRLIFKGPFCYEHMMRVPVMIRVPARFGGTGSCRVKDIPLVNVDFVPTILDLCGIGQVECDGISFKQLLTGKSRYQIRRDFVIGQYYSKQKWVNPIRMIRTNEFKYNRYQYHGHELYDLRNDPDELVNLVNDPKYLRIKQTLQGVLDAWIKANGDPFYTLKSTDRKGRILQGVNAG